MKKVILNTAILLLFCLLFSKMALATETASRCLSCDTVLHAVQLSEIEKYLQKNNVETVAQLDEKAKEWFSTFQEGGMFFDGWKDISDKVISNVAEKDMVQTKLQMLALGTRMGCEWSKENDIRKISTKMLKNWGKEIREIVNNRPAEIASVIRKIEGEVDDILITVQ